MDKRDTIITSESFLPILTELRLKKEKASFLIDQDGISRIEGYIKEVIQYETVLKSKILMEAGDEFLAEEIIAINGVFKSDYSEC